MRRSKDAIIWRDYKKHWETTGDLDDGLYLVGDNAEIEEKQQYLFMLEQDLKPEHTFLDLGCGCLRGTIKLVDYLKEGNFYGLDVSESLINLAGERAPKANLKVNTDFQIDKYFPDTKFDYILSVSVLTHLFPEDVETLFKNVAKVLRGTYYFTIYPADYNYGNIGIHYYDINWIIKTGKKHGLKIEELDGEVRLAREHSIIPVFNSRLGQWAMRATLL
jgi:SAM-dependent methyltransferase